MRSSEDGCLTAMIVAAVVVLLVGGVAMQAYECHSKAAALGLECSWGPIQGCIVTRKDGVRVDIDNYGRSDAQ